MDVNVFDVPYTFTERPRRREVKPGKIWSNQTDQDESDSLV